MITSNLFLYYKITIPTLKLKNVRHEYMFPGKGNKMVQLLILVGKVQNKATLKSYFTCPCRKNNPKAWWKTVGEAYGAPHLQVKYKLEWLERGKVGILYLQIYKYMYPLAWQCHFLEFILDYVWLWKIVCSKRQAPIYSYLYINNIWQITNVFPPIKHSLNWSCAFKSYFFIDYLCCQQLTATCKNRKLLAPCSFIPSLLEIVTRARCYKASAI